MRPGQVKNTDCPIEVTSPGSQQFSMVLFILVLRIVSQNFTKPLDSFGFGRNPLAFVNHNVPRCPPDAWENLSSAEKKGRLADLNRARVARHRQNKKEKEKEKESVIINSNVTRAASIEETIQPFAAVVENTEQVPKGSRQVLMERQLWVPLQSKVKNCQQTKAAKERRAAAKSRRQDSASGSDEDVAAATARCTKKKMMKRRFSSTQQRVASLERWSTRRTSSRVYKRSRQFSS